MISYQSVERNPLREVVCAAALAAVLTTSAWGIPPYFSGLGDLPGGSFQSTGYAVSSGEDFIVVGHSNSSDGEEAFRWTLSGGMVGLGDLPGGDFGSAAYGIGISPDDGIVIVGHSSSASSGSGAREAYRWSQSGGMVGLGDLSGSPFNSRGRGVSADGSVVAGQGNFNNGGNVEAFRWTSAGGMVGLGFIPGATSFSEAFAVSGNGLAIVGTASVDPSGTLLAFRWTAATGIVSLGDLPGSNLHSSGGAVNFDGSVVVGTGDIGSSEGQAYRWTQAGGMVGLGDLPGGPFNSQGLGVSGNGSVVVGSSATSTLGPAGQGEEAFIWDEVNGMRNLKDVLVNEYNLNLTGWTLYHAEGISPDGLNIVGWGRNPSGQTEAWVVHIPEPSTSALLSLGAGAFLRRRKQSGAAR